MKVQKKIGKAKQVGVDANQELVLVISDDEGNDMTISWNRIGTVGEVIFLRGFKWKYDSSVRGL